MIIVPDKRPRKALSISVTDTGILIVPRELQPLNTWLPMVVTVLGITILLSAKQL